MMMTGLCRNSEKEMIALNEKKRLADIAVGESARIIGLLDNGSIHRRLLDMGLTENCRIECVGKSPLGDPMAYLIRGAVIAIRSEDGKNILIE